MSKAIGETRMDGDKCEEEEGEEEEMGVLVRVEARGFGSKTCVVDSRRLTICPWGWAKWIERDGVREEVEDEEEEVEEVIEDARGRGKIAGLGHQVGFSDSDVGVTVFTQMHSQSLL